MEQDTEVSAEVLDSKFELATTVSIIQYKLYNLVLYIVIFNIS